MSETVVIALATGAGAILGYLIKLMELAMNAKTQASRNAVDGFSSLCERLTTRLTTVENQLAEAQRRISELEDQVTGLQIENAQLRTKMDSQRATQ